MSLFQEKLDCRWENYLEVVIYKGNALKIGLEFFF